MKRQIANIKCKLQCEVKGRMLNAKKLEVSDTGLQFFVSLENLSSCRQNYNKHGTLWMSTFNPDIAMVQIDKLGTDCQAEP